MRAIFFGSFTISGDRKRGDKTTSEQIDSCEEHVAELEAENGRLIAIIKRHSICVVCGKRKCTGTHKCIGAAPPAPRPQELQGIHIVVNGVEFHYYGVEARLVPDGELGEERTTILALVVHYEGVPFCTHEAAWIDTDKIESIRVDDGHVSTLIWTKDEPAAFEREIGTPAPEKPAAPASDADIVDEPTLNPAAPVVKAEEPTKLRGNMETANEPPAPRPDYPWNHHPTNQWTREDQAFVDKMKKAQKDEPAPAAPITPKPTRSGVEPSPQPVVENRGALPEAEHKDGKVAAGDDICANPSCKHARYQHDVNCQVLGCRCKVFKAKDGGDELCTCGHHRSEHDMNDPDGETGCFHVIKPGDDTQDFCGCKQFKAKDGDDQP
jgi:hypothetical protein